MKELSQFFHIFNDVIEVSVKLADLLIGTHARVLSYESDNDYTRQLLRLGLVPGTVFEVIRRAPLGDPIEIRVRGFSLALRPSEAQHVALERVTP